MPAAITSAAPGASAGCGETTGRCWRTESGGATRENIEAWCLECFANNFAVPRETVALLAADVAGYARLIEEDRWKALTLKSVLRDAAVRVARKHRGRVVLGRRDDDVLVEFATSQDAVEAARSLGSAFQMPRSRFRRSVGSGS